VGGENKSHFSFCFPGFLSVSLSVSLSVRFHRLGIHLRSFGDLGWLQLLATCWMISLGIGVPAQGEEGGAGCSRERREGRLLQVGSM